jgi:hypothetical protein
MNCKMTLYASLLGGSFLLAACRSVEIDELSKSTDWQAELLEWRRDREARLASPSGYLALSDLVWLSEGDNTLGSDPESALVLTGDEIPAQVGVLRLGGGSVSFRLTDPAQQADSLEVNVNPLPALVGESDASGHAAGSFLLASDATEGVNRVTLGRRTFWVIDRAGKIGIRVRDPESPVLESFTGTEWFEPDVRWRVRARFVPHAAARQVDVPNILGTVYDDLSPGVLQFEQGGRVYQLQPTGVSKDEMTLIFGDATNGQTTYGGGRFLSVPAPDADGSLWLDFNRAYNPPCAFSPFTTCPLPPDGNRLDVSIPAGERAPASYD